MQTPVVSKPVLICVTMKKLFLFLWVSVFLIASVPTSHAAIKGYETWMGTYFHGKKLGFTHLKLKVRAKETVINMRVYFRMVSEGVDQSTTFIQETSSHARFKIETFHSGAGADGAPPEDRSGGEKRQAGTSGDFVRLQEKRFDFISSWNGSIIYLSPQYDSFRPERWEKRKDFCVC